MDRGSQLSKDDEDDKDDKDNKEDEEEEERRTRQEEAEEEEEKEEEEEEEEATDIKSNNPHLAGGEKIYINKTIINIVPDNYLEHRFGIFLGGTRALLRTFSANRETYVLSNLEHMRILYLEHTIIYTCKYIYIYIHTI